MAIPAKQRQALINAAVRAMTSAYAPYSDYHVGAALLTVDGSVVAGCNVENASYGLTMCAERVAVGVAVAGGDRSFSAIAIATVDGGSPCGACRQVLAEFASDMTVLMVDAATQTVRETSLAKLLPDRFELS